MNKLTEEEIEEIADLCAGLYHNYNAPNLRPQIKALLIEEGFLKEGEK